MNYIDYSNIIYITLISFSLLFSSFIILCKPNSKSSIFLILVSISLSIVLSDSTQCFYYNYFNTLNLFINLFSLNLNLLFSISNCSYSLLIHLTI